MEYGRRYTVALTWVRRHESMVAVLRRLLARTREKGLKIKRVLVDRAFFKVPVHRQRLGQTLKQGRPSPPERKPVGQVAASGKHGNATPRSPQNDAQHHRRRASPAVILDQPGLQQNIECP